MKDPEDYYLLAYYLPHPFTDLIIKLKTIFFKIKWINMAVMGLQKLGLILKKNYLYACSVVLSGW